MQLEKLIEEVMLAVASRSKKALHTALIALDDSQLLENRIPPQVLDIYLWLLSDGDAISAPGVDKVFVNFTGDIHKYSHEQISDLISTIDANRDAYKSQALRMAATDFVARNGEVGLALAIFERWASSGDEISHQMAEAGIDILLRGSRILDIEMRKKAEMLRDSLMRSG
ncbi:hypothetical protein V4890_15240 [Ralstonia solanacearum species complex bacterium KE056]|uniref:hypothetical protein n=1 Tax=Ralstonia solanacearum species complex bacterium KE056 TaxID=3119585 RepID=UPI002FC29C25